MIDSHTHIDLTLERDPGLENTIFEEAFQNGIDTIIQIAGDKNSYEYSRKLAHSKLPVEVYYTIGLHPGEAHEVNTQIGLNFAQANQYDPRFVAIGEIGLEYYYASEHKKKQIDVFHQYLDLAVKMNKPVTIHTRDAFSDTMDILKEYSDKIRILIHCFTGDEDQMYAYAERGFYISYSGIVTFKNAKAIQKAAINTPLNQILIETDAPYLTPVPHRGKINQPAYVKHTLEFIASLRNIDYDKMKDQITKNTRQFYGLPKQSNL